MPGSDEPPSLHEAETEQSGDWGNIFRLATDPARDRIPVERLGPGSGEPILFYDEVMLYEDELGDNGSSMLNVKVVRILSDKARHAAGISRFTTLLPTCG